MKLITAINLATPIDRWLGRPTGVTFDWRPEIKDLPKLDEIKAGEGLLLPLQRVPIGNSEQNDWVVAALSPRFQSHVKLKGFRSWVHGKALWMDDAESFAPHCRSTLYQAKTLRPDLDFKASDDDAAYVECFWWETDEASKKIHPMEITPPAANGILALVTRKEDTATRTEALGWHDNETAILSNVERSILKHAIENGCEAAVYAEQDQHGRYHLFLAVGQGSTWQKTSFVHDGWKGLVRVGTSFIDGILGKDA